jgi:hypothetical protein
MFDSEPKLFYIGTISLPLNFLEIMVINTIHAKKTIDATNVRAKSHCIISKVVPKLLINSRSI